MRFVTVAAAGLVCLAGCASPSDPAPHEHAVQAPSAADERVRAAEAQLAASPKLYPVWAELGEARLDQARVSRDPERVRDAHAAFGRSLEIQENFVALRGMTALANFRHRFVDALQWAERAAPAYPEDSSVLGMRVEASLLLGRIDEAEGWLRAHGEHPDDFHAVAARARVLGARGLTAEAVKGYVDASRIARERSPQLAQWALVRAAAAAIDAGDPAQAPALLEEALTLAPTTIDVEVHFAEAEDALGRTKDALARLERALERQDDPTVHAAAARLARKLGKKDSAHAHFDAARASFQRAIDAGEAYTLGAQAALLADAEVELDLALRLAREHETFVRDAASRKLIQRIALLRAGARSGAGS